MSETTYTIEYAKSGRSKCKRCKEPIVKGDLRLGVVVPGKEGGFDMTSYHHVECFRLPRKFANAGPTQMSPAEFIEEMVTDLSEGDILPSRIDELAEKLGSKFASGAKRKSAGGDGGEADTSTLMGRLKQAVKDEEAGKERPAKKQKKKKEGESFEDLLELYKKYHKTKADDLKDILRWNGQFLTGKKDWILFKILDGSTHGRLGNCGICGGRLKLQEPDEDELVCNGRFDEDTNLRLPCSNKVPRLEAPRFQPWYDRETTEEEKEAMKQEAESARGEDGGAANDSPEAQDLLKAAAKMDWKLVNSDGIKSATKELVSLVEGKVDLPPNQKPKMVLGKIVLSSKDKTPQEIVQEVIDKYGFAERKEKKAALKEANAETMCANPKNAPLLLAFKELAELYFKEGNRNAGASYTKVVGAVQGMKQEITAENAMSFSKGKTKIPNIGKGSAEKMKEFCTTGTMQKLEEKRADNA